MSTLSVTFLAPGRCRVEHVDSGALVATDLPPEYGGGGRSFSSTDLLAAALGSCIATSVEAVAARHGVGSGEIGVTVEKTLAERPRRVARLAVRVLLPVEPDDKLRTKLERAIGLCPVHRSLAEEVAVTVELVAQVPP